MHHEAYYFTACPWNGRRTICRASIRREDQHPGKKRMHDDGRMATPGATDQAVTSRSRRMISFSASFNSASITSSGRGGVYLMCLRREERVGRAADIRLRALPMQGMTRLPCLGHSVVRVTGPCVGPG